MAEILNKEEFRCLWNIVNSWETDPVKASESSLDDVEKFNKIFKKLQDLGFIILEMRGGRIHNAKETAKGKSMANDRKYECWRPI